MIRIWLASALMARQEGTTQHLDIVTAQDVGTEDEIRGRVAKAFQDLRPGHGMHALTLSDITEFCRAAVVKLDARAP